MQRSAYQYLEKWKDSPIRMPLMLRGARQVGKSYLVEQFGQQNFEDVIIVNFELNKQLATSFESLDPKQICIAISAVFEKQIIPGKTLLFLDEIQECPIAIQALRYFYEKMPQLHVIAAGSLLEFVLSDMDFSMPVGRIEYLYLQPMSFEEFLIALEAHQFLDYIKHYKFGEVIPDAIHKRGLDLVKQYCIVGGMPKVVDTYVKHDDLLLTQQMQDRLLNTYRDDFHKYGKRMNTQLCGVLFDKAPKLIARHFKYTDIDSDKQSKQIKPVLAAMVHAGVYHNIYAVNVQGIPLNGHIIHKKRKLLFIDTALIKRMSRIDAELLMTEDLSLVNQGQITEQFIGQELLAYQPFDIKPELFYWQRDAKSASAEIDYVLQFNDAIVPIEVKSGHSGRLKSLHYFLSQSDKYPHISKVGIKISKDTFSFHQNVMSVPFYLVRQIKRLLSTL